MAGRNQHHIPQFYQRAFGVPTGGRPKEIWEFIKGRSPTLVAIKRAAVDRDFYSPPSPDGSRTLDGKITDLETPLARLVAQVREIPAGGSVDANMAAEIVSHLAPRTSHFRASFEHGLKCILSKATAAFTDSKNVERLLGLNADAPTDRFRKQLREALKEDERFRQVGLPEPVLEKVAFQLAKEHFERSSQLGLPEISSTPGVLISNTESLVRDGHNKGLDSVIDKNVRQELLITFVWSVEVAPPVGAVLPDCVVLGVQDDKVVYPFMMISNDKLESVIMPLSSRKLLVGRRHGVAFPDLVEFNENAAACSHSFYLAASDATAIAELSPFIGQRSLVVVDEALKGTFEDFVPSHQSTGLMTEPSAETAATVEGGAAKDGVPEQADSQALEYQVSFLDCANQETAESIAALIKDIINEVNRLMSLGRLDGITFAKDYPTALRSVDRGMPGARPAETVSNEIGVGIAMTVMVMRGGIVKCRIVMADGIAHALIAEDVRANKWALHIIVHELALVAMTELIDRAFPDVFLNPFTDLHDGWLFSGVNAALDGYFAAYVSGRFGDDEMLVTYRELLIGALNRARTVIPEARLAYRSHGEIDTLLHVSLPAVRHVLQFAAKLLGHCEALGRSPFDDDGQLGSALEQNGLRAWLPVFQNDLKAFRLRLGDWKSIDEFFAFNRHVERVLWQFGLFPWRNPEGQSRVEVPLATDMHAILATNAAALNAANEPHVPL